jgi:RNase P subunit RPR2
MPKIVDALIEMRIKQLFDQAEQNVCKSIESTGGLLVDRVDRVEVDRRLSTRSTIRRLVCECGNVILMRNNLSIMGSFAQY